MIEEKADGESIADVEKKRKEDDEDDDETKKKERRIRRESRKDVPENVPGRNAITL